MIGSAAVAIIQEKLGFRSDKQTEILDKLIQEQRLLETGLTLPAFLIQEDRTLSLTAEVQFVTLPSGFLKLVDDDLPYYATSSGGTFYLQQSNWDHIRKVYATSDNGPPKSFAIRRRRMYVAPTPAIATDLTWSYYARGDTISLAAENAWLNESSDPYGVPYLLIGRAGRKMAENIEADQRIINFFREMEGEWHSRLIAMTVEAETAGPVTMGEEIL